LQSYRRCLAFLLNLKLLRTVEKKSGKYPTFHTFNDWLGYHVGFDSKFKIQDNLQLRIPQREGWQHIQDHFREHSGGNEVGVVLPVGCGKSGLIAITPFATEATRVLVIAPGLRIRDQLAADLKANSERNVYERFGVLEPSADYPETVVVESGRVNLDDLQHSDVVVANIHQIAGEENRWLDQLGPDFFDLILVDEAHHNTASSWQQVKQRFPGAKIVNFSATPLRADGRVMKGDIIYSYPVIEAIRAGYVKRLQAKMLSPTELRFVDRSGGQERVIGPEEVRALGESDAEFRRGIVMSDETLNSIVDHSVTELRRLQTETGEQRLKIIASAVNLDHCIQITQAFRERGLKAEYVHSREGSVANDAVLKKLDNHEIQVIVQARMLGEGFDHPHLAVAMVGNLYANLSPFVQYVGRVMRAIVPGQAGHPLNQGVVVFHAGANVARRWSDFRSFSEADQDYFSELLPEAEEVGFSGQTPLMREPGHGPGLVEPVEVLEQTGVRAADMPPIGDPKAAALLQELAELGITPDQAAQEIRRLRTTRQARREASRQALNDRVQHEVGRMLGKLKINPGGKTLDRSRRANNFAWAAGELNKRVNQEVDGASGDRQNFSLEQLEKAHTLLPVILGQVEAELQNG
jgi:superfamily II DNA or RNA helicase